LREHPVIVKSIDAGYKDKIKFGKEFGRGHGKKGKHGKRLSLT
jgi:hypothetical protein